MNFKRPQAALVIRACIGEAATGEVLDFCNKDFGIKPTDLSIERLLAAFSKKYHQSGEKKSSIKEAQETDKPKENPESPVEQRRVDSDEEKKGDKKDKEPYGRRLDGRNHDLG